MTTTQSEVWRRVANVLRQLMPCPQQAAATSPIPPPRFTSRSAAYLYSRVPPPITLDAYAAHLGVHMWCSPECAVLAVVYAMRLMTSGAVALIDITVHRVFATCLVIAAKFHDDTTYKMPYYAKVTGFPVAELRIMELCVLEALDFRTVVDPEDYALMVEAMVETDMSHGEWAWRHHLLAVNHHESFIAAAYEGKAIIASTDCPVNRYYPSLCLAWVPQLLCRQRVAQWYAATTHTATESLALCVELLNVSLGGLQADGLHDAQPECRIGQPWWLSTLVLVAIPTAVATSATSLHLKS